MSHNATLVQELNSFLQQELGNDVLVDGGLTPLQGGFDTDTYSFAVGNAPAEFPQSLVLRHFRHPRESKRVVRESTIQNVAAKSGRLVPRVPVDSEGKLLDGRPFLLMERLPGKNLGQLVMEDDPDAQKFPELMAILQSGLHKIDTSGLRRRLAQAGIDVEHMKPTRLLEDITAIAGAINLPDFNELSRWLTDGFPQQPENPSLVHGDLHPNNILMHEGKVSGLIDWATSIFSHPEYDVAVSRSILTIGPPEGIGVPEERLRELLDWATAEYMKHSHAHEDLDNSLIDYYAVLRLSHAFFKVAGKRRNVEHPNIAHDGYAWDTPKQYATITRIVQETTGIKLVSA